MRYVLRLAGASLLTAAALVVTAAQAQASVAGTNAARVTVSVETKQGGKWIDARRSKADRKGVLTFKNVLPGKYKFIIDKDDRTTGQTLGLKLRLLDDAGRQIRGKRADVDLYVYVGDTKVFIARYRTDKDGWLDLAGITSGTVYEMDVKDDASLKHKAQRPRIKMRAKVQGSKWFRAAYKRLSTDGVLRVEDVLPGKYKFRYNRKDGAAKPFTLKARFRDAKGKLAKKKRVKIYAYPFGVRTYVGTFRTDRKGWLTLPGVMPAMKYKIVVKK